VCVCVCVCVCFDVVVVVVVVVVVCLRRGPERSLRQPFERRLNVGANIMCPPD
jgi:hypothetical protein